MARGCVHHTEDETDVGEYACGDICGAMTTAMAPASFGFDESKMAGGSSGAILRDQISRSFTTYDSNKKGYLTRDDLKCAFASLIGSIPSRREVTHMLSLCSGDDEGVSLNVFGLYMLDRLHEMHDGESHYQRCERARTVFRAFDVKQAGYLTLEDTLNAFALAVPGVSPEIVTDVFREADVDGVGKVTYDLFEKMYSAGSMAR